MDDLEQFATYEEFPLVEASSRAVDVPAEMVLQIATGLEDPLDIARRFGFTDDTFRSLSSWPPFLDQVAAKRVELQKSGVTFRIQCAFMAEDLAKDVYRIAKLSDVTLPQKLETFRTMAKLADLEPKPSQGLQQGVGFSISINFPAALPAPAPQPRVVSEQ